MIGIGSVVFNVSNFNVKMNVTTLWQQATAKFAPVMVDTRWFLDFPA
jgi:hypothetical protein